ncbi:MAG: hypothetical protein GY770_01725 [Aestuariibacter sp.]|nr:hypothetical protein [Aestuariibacter sp.]MCP4529287.1 hypothetical protein [Aestuariibacter sp.]MCP5017461.1 hypothetical protein [Ketobacter sp.]
MRCIQLINKLASEYQNITGKTHLPLPASSNEMQQMVSIFEKKMAYHPGSEYLNFLSHWNGLSLDGIVIFKTGRDSNGHGYDGFIEANEAFWKDDDLKRFICYGEDDTSRLVFNLTKNTWQLVDRTSWDEIDNFESFDDALCSLLEVHA